MCGIIGFTGNGNAVNILTVGLTELEYRGYDSAGISVFEGDTIKTIKARGKVSCLKDKITQGAGAFPGKAFCGIGHTRWATHGGVSERNCHPHTAGRVTLIHNGIIENYRALEKDLRESGKKPLSQTDSEIVAMLIDFYYDGNPVKAIRKAVGRLDGSYACCILFSDQPGVIYAIRKGSPLVAASVTDGSLVASDPVALLRYTKDYFVLPENCIARLTAEEITVTDPEHHKLIPKLLHADWDTASAKKGGYDYYMLKEIHDQPQALYDTLEPRVTDGLPDFTGDDIPDSLLSGIRRIIITACGTAMHAGIIGKSLIERLTRIPVCVEIASEFRYQNPILEDGTLVITISQSGETADTLAALRLAKEAGCPVLSAVNVKGSTLARESDYVFYTHAGPEIAVASTKAYTVQLAFLYLFAFRLALVKGCLSLEETVSYTKSLNGMPGVIRQMLTYDKQLKAVSASLIHAKDLFFIGRGLDYALSCEGSIKLKEVSYIHSEAYAAGELKHGTISLITDNVPVIALATQQPVYAKLISNVKEVRSRGARVILITNADAQVDASLCDHHIVLPSADDPENLFAPFAAVVALQYIAYFTALAKDLNVDQPRNLAKSVTVE